MNRKLISRLLWIIIVVLAGIFVLLPVFRPGLLVTDDGGWMVIRLSAFYQSLREGQFPVRFLGRLNYSYGYPVANFLYPGFLYVGSILHGAGLSFQNSVEVIIVGSIVGGSIALFLWLRYFFDYRASAFGTISFLYMPYLLYDIFKRGSVGEIVAIQMCIIVLYAIESKRHWILTPALAFLAISHNTLAMFFIPVLFGYIVVKQYWDLIFAFVIGLGMSAFFWLPAIIDKHTVLFDRVAVSDPRQYFSASHLIIFQGLPFLLAAVIAVFMRAKFRNKERRYFFILLFGSTLLAIQLSVSVWVNAAFAKFIQFPYRFLALWSFAGPWFIAYIASLQKKTHWVIVSLSFVIILFIVSLPYQQAESVVRPEGFYSTNEGTTTVANEYMPTWVSKLPTQRSAKRQEIYRGNAIIEERRVNTDKIHILIHAKEESVVQINTIYYPGWGAMLDNKRTTILYDNPGGLMRVLIPAGNHELYMAFRETWGRFLADIVSVIFFVLYIIFFALPTVGNKVILFIRKKHQA